VAEAEDRRSLQVDVTKQPHSKQNCPPKERRERKRQNRGEASTRPVGRGSSRGRRGGGRARGGRTAAIPAVEILKVSSALLVYK
jgi:hypothetical protein